MKVRNTFYYDAATGGTGGASLADLGLNEDKSGIEGGDGSTLIPSINDATPAGDPDPDMPVGDPKPAPPVAIEGVNPDGTIQDGYVKDETTGAVTKVPDTVEGVNADGTIQEGYIKKDDGTVVKDPEYKEPEPEGDFFEAVEKLTGVKVEVEYPEGIDPNTPEGVALREQKLIDIGMTQLEQHIQKSDPRAYAYMLHRQAGGADEDFFGTKQGYVLPVKENLETDADAQAAVYKYDLISKGNSPDEAEALVSLAIKNNVLAAKATASYTAIETAQKAELERLQKQVDDATKAEREAIGTMSSTIDKAITNNLSFVVPENVKPAFKQFVADNLRYQDGKFYIVQELGAETLKNQLEALLFQYKKGDLSTIIKKQAATQTSQRLTLRANQSTQAGKTGEGLGKSSKGSVALGSII